MKRITGIKTYRYDSGIDIETAHGKRRMMIMVTENQELYEAWLYCDGYGIMTYMFGGPKWQDTYAEFIDMVEANLEDYIPELAEYMY